ncbi:unnamed protein product, partial [marine sediment metagenome]
MFVGTENSITETTSKTPLYNPPLFPNQSITPIKGLNAIL